MRTDVLVIRVLALYHNRKPLLFASSMLADVSLREGYEGHSNDSSHPRSSSEGDLRSTWYSLAGEYVSLTIYDCIGD